MAQKQNTEIQLPEIPQSASPELVAWWRSVKYALDQLIPTLIQNVNDHTDGRIDFLRLTVLSSPPADIEDGMVIHANGTTFNPGSGAGVYERVGGVWKKL